MFVDLIKENAWRNMHNVLHGGRAIFRTLKSTKEIVKDAHERKLNGKFSAKESTKGLIDCIEYYGRYKDILDD